MAIKHEHVLVYPRRILDELGPFYGLNTNAHPYIEEILKPEHLQWMLREDAENDPSFKQIIPYVVIVNGSDVFTYTRGKQAGEQRLVAQRSVGIGGHISQEDHGLFTDFGPALYEAAKAREVDEEIVVSTPYEERLLGVINDDTSDVGRVHFGIAHVWDVATRDVQKREAQITQTAFTAVEDLMAEPDALESWSLFCVEALAAELGITR